MKKPNKEDYFDLKLYEELANFAYKIYRKTDNEQYLSRYIDLRKEINDRKRRIRSYNRTMDIECPVFVKDLKFGEAIEKFDLGPIEHWTMKSIKEFMDSMWLDIPTFAFDCTGRLFSTRMTQKVLHGNVIIYHWISRDV